MNPHNLLSALDPPAKAGEGDSRKWKCSYCDLEGTWDEVKAIPCTFVYPPCEDCGETPECAEDCPGMLAIVGAVRGRPN